MDLRKRFSLCKQTGAVSPSLHVGRWKSRPVGGRLERIKTRELWSETPARLQVLVAEVDRLRLAFREEWRHLDHAGAALDQQVSRIRMLPFSHCCVGLNHIVRDLARASGKEVELRIEGGEVELDRSILEGLKDPLRHLIRNAINNK